MSYGGRVFLLRRGEIPCYIARKEKCYMSYFTSSFPITEVQLDENNHPIASYNKNLPHHDFICEKICDIWNNMHSEKHFEGIFKRKIISSVMSYKTDDIGRSMLQVNLVFISGFRLTSKRKEEISRQLVAQFLKRKI